MKRMICAAGIICFCMIVGQALCVENLPEDSMDPNYEPETVQIEDEDIVKDVAPIDEPEIEEQNKLQTDEAVEDRDYITHEGEIGEIQAGEKSITRED